jgi:LysM repeat protein
LPSGDISQDQTISVNVSGAVAQTSSGTTGGSSATGGSATNLAPGFITTSLPNGTVQQLYSATIQTESYFATTFSSGTLPPGLTLSPTGVITGVPTTGGSYNFTVSAQNQYGTTKQNYTITINGGGTVTGQVVASQLAPAFIGLQMQDPGLQMQNEPAVAGAQVTAGQSYTVKKGDTLIGISRKFYGTGNNWRKILAANPRSLSIPGDTHTLKIGAQLTIPNLNQ